jgi:hypothetical protein
MDQNKRLLYCPNCGHGQHYPYQIPEQYENMICDECGVTVCVWDWLYCPPQEFVIRWKQRFGDKLILPFYLKKWIDQVVESKEK